MGYYPAGNEEKQEAPLPVPEKWQDLDLTWADVDAALDDLYTVCAAGQIPITAHCSPLGARGETGESANIVTAENEAHPTHWEAVLDGHPGLRLNLAHTGGSHFHNVETPGSAEDWAHGIAALMGRDDVVVYSDRSCQTPPLENAPGGLYQLFLDRHVEVLHSDAGQGRVAERLMYGSDWHLALMYAGGARHARERFADLFARSEFGDLPGLVPGFLGDNAARFLGICSGDGDANRNRGRLETFYTETLGLAADEFPGWWERI
jgi:predicted TIM-barrel fold metal-dependent hydrolase